MSIRLLMTADAIGGVWTYAMQLAGGLTDHGVATTIAVLGPSPDPAWVRAAQLLPGVEVVDTGLPLDWLSNAAGTRRAASELAELASRMGADLVHLNSPSLASGTEWPVPVVGVAHGCLATWWNSVRSGEPLPGDMHWHRQMMQDGLAVCDRVIAPSAAFAKALQTTYGLARLPRVIANGRTWPLDSKPGRPAPFVLTAGRLWDEAKNASVLDEVAASIDARFEAAGPVEGPAGERACLRHLVVLGNLAPDALARRMAQRPVFVSAASFEPFGLSVLEAAASGCALVLSDIPTFRELWEGAADLVPHGDVAAFADAIRGALREPSRRALMGERARERAAHYSVARMAKATVDEYHAALHSYSARQSHPRTEQDFPKQGSTVGQAA